MQRQLALSARSEDFRQLPLFFHLVSPILGYRLFAKRSDALAIRATRGAVRC
jgi:hypothetical protein